MKKLSARTLGVLKNFASINKNLFAQKGNRLSTISEAKNILAFAKIEEDLENDFGIYDLNEFLGAYRLLDDPTLDFDEKSVAIMSGRSKVRYHFADESILTYPTKKITMPPADVTVNISNEVLTLIGKAATALNHSVMSLKNENGNIVLSVVDPENSTANVYSITIVEDSGITADFDLQFLIANLKVVPGDYEVSISSRLISHWSNTTDDIEYYIALEKSSNYTA